MSHHARLRCEQMGIPTKIVKWVVRDHTCSWTNAAGQTVATSDRYPDLAVAYADSPDGRPIVMTVLYRTQGTYSRPT